MFDMDADVEWEPELATPETRIFRIQEMYARRTLTLGDITEQECLDVFGSPKAVMAHSIPERIEGP